MGKKKSEIVYNGPGPTADNVLANLLFFKEMKT